jgi:hypothetical protein
LEEKETGFGVFEGTVLAYEENKQKIPQLKLVTVSLSCKFWALLISNLP